MRALTLSLPVLTMTCLVETAVAAPLVEANYPFGHGDMYLLAQSGVQKDLQLTAEQTRRIHQLVKEIIDNYQELNDAGRRGRADWIDLALTFLRRNEKIALSILTPAQAQRLREIDYQYLVTAAFWDPATRRILSITDEQFARISSMPYKALPADERSDELQRIGDEFNSYPKRPERDWQFREWKRLAVLTPAQRRQWKEMLGQPLRAPIPTPIHVPAQRD